MRDECLAEATARLRPNGRFGDPLRFAALLRGGFFSRALRTGTGQARARGFLPGLAAAACLGASLSIWAAGITQHFDIKEQSLAQALMELGAQSGLTVVAPSVLTAGKTAASIRGDMSPAQALERLLNNSGLTFTIGTDGTIAIHSAVKPIANARVTQTNASPAAVRTNDGAADPNEEEAPKNVNAIDEIRVTATRREENIQSTPMSISALSGKDISEKGLAGMADYLRTIPGISYLDQGAGRNATVIRGVSINPQSEGLSVGQTVGVYFGEVPLSGIRWSAADIKLVDMERIEVLRGPQGTLFGAGSLSGAIRNIPVAPNLRQLAGSVDVGFSATARNGGNNDAVKGVVNLPLISDKLAVRLVGYRFADEGYIKNIAANDPATLAKATTWGITDLARNEDNVGTTDYVGGRAAVLWRPAERLSATLTYLNQKLKQDGLPEFDISKGLYQQARMQLGAVIGGGEDLSDDTEIGNLVLQYDLPAVKLVSSSSYGKQFYRRDYEIGQFFSNRPIPQLYWTDMEGFNQELRAVSSFAGPLQFVAGLYYEDTKFVAASQSVYSGDPALNPYNAIVLIDIIERQKLRQKSVFGEASYTLAEKLTATVGVRHFDYERDAGRIASGPLTGAADTYFTAGETGNSYKVGLSYTPAEDALIYATWSQGFRVGRPQAPRPAVCDADGDGFIDGLPGVTNSPSLIASDNLDNYELGGKFAFFDRRLIVNAAVYSIKWSGLPVSINTGCGFNTVVNAGRAESHGGELDSAFYLTPNLRINVTASYVNAELDGLSPGIGADGDRLPGSPELQYSAGMHYSFDSLRFPMFLRVDYSYVGGFYNNVRQTGIEAGDYGQVNATLGATINQFEVNLFGANLTNADDITWIDSSFGNRGTRLRPRTIGVNAVYRFGN